MVEIKVLLPDDWRLWRELRLQALAEAPYAFGATLAYWQGDGDQEQKWRARLDIPGSRNLVAFLEGHPVGMASGVPDSNNVGTIELISLWVSPDGRGTGVGDRLLDYIEQWATDLNFQTMRLSVRPSNEAAIRLYRRHGLRDAGEKGDSTTDDTSLEIVMEKRLRGLV
ncbi:acyl-CoA N-acyltransferase [Corynascus novoguineensis]|uniref:Acyl-CoA N-acyltransferase n=1 Tax=Corynascus novoguineensis TaxID=1126955 RepID=A0AAN7CR64_9PEZI|nr:acyl-CoA N-acyltransferase [Corynascus novoguineensis]